MYDRQLGVFLGRY